MGRRRLLTAAVLGVLLLVGCSSAPLDEAPPQRFDLSGVWLLQADLSDAPPSAGALESEPLPLPGDRNRTRPRLRRGNLAFVAHDFPVMVAQRMTIEQNRDSMGIDYDRGAYRDISWGRRDRGLWQVDTGWNEAGQLEIRSDANDARAVEVMMLSPDRDRLTVTLQLKTENQAVDVRRVFSRAP